MLLQCSKGITISTLFNNEIITLNDSLDWSIWLKRVRDVSDNTLKIFMKSMDKFWQWTLYNPIGMEESFPSYQARYREALREGFTITTNNYYKEFDENIEITVLSSNPLQKVTINKEIYIIHL